MNNGSNRSTHKNTYQRQDSNEKEGHYGCIRNVPSSSYNCKMIVLKCYSMNAYMACTTLSCNNLIASAKRHLHPPSRHEGFEAHLPLWTCQPLATLHRHYGHCFANYEIFTLQQKGSSPSDPNTTNSNTYSLAFLVSFSCNM